MIRIRISEAEQRVNISLKCQINPSTEKEFNLNRSLDESILATFQKLFNNFSKQVKAKEAKTNKKLKKEEKAIDMNLVEEEPPIYLYDRANIQLPSSTLNRNAWKDNYIFRIEDQSFIVAVNLPCIKKMSISKVMIAGLAGVVKVEFDADETLLETINKNSKYLWYYSSKTINSSEIDKTTKLDLDWTLMEEGLNLKTCRLHECTKDRFIKVVCIPGNGEREGLAFEVVSKDVVREKIELNELPMTDRHKLTETYLESDRLRVMTYNILANCYSDTAAAKEILFSHCPLEFLDFRYRRLLLVHEIINYRADVIFLQECETDFLEEDLKSSMTNYQHLIKTKIGSKEGSGTLFRKDRFKFIKSHDISITDELKTNTIFEKLWKNISSNEKFLSTINERNTIFQVTQVESLDQPGKHFLLANTHLFFHPSADFTRLLQAIVCAKYIEKLKFDLFEQSSDVKESLILFGGDFNSDPPSHAFTYLFTQSIPFESLTEDEKVFLRDTDEDLVHSINLSAYADFPYTNYTMGFNGILDYVFYESSAFELEKIIPIPSIEKVQENVAMPSRVLPSDHVALVFELKIK